MWSKILSGTLILFFFQRNELPVDALNNGLALTPPMGWMSWQRFRCIIDCESYPDECIRYLLCSGVIVILKKKTECCTNLYYIHIDSERLFKTAADLIASEGYKDVGYEYVIIDDCWLEFERDSVTKELVPDRKRFPNGIKALADYVCR